MIGDGDLLMGWSDAEDVSEAQSSRTRSIVIDQGSNYESHESTPDPKSLVENVKCDAERTPLGSTRETGRNRKAAARLLEVSYRMMLRKIDRTTRRLPLPRNFRKST